MLFGTEVVTLLFHRFATRWGVTWWVTFVLGVIALVPVCIIFIYIYTWNLKDVDTIPLDTVDGRNRSNQLRLVVYPIIYEVLYIQTVVGLGIWKTINSMCRKMHFKKTWLQDVLSSIAQPWNAMIFSSPINQPMVSCWKCQVFLQGGVVQLIVNWWFGFLGFPCARDG